MFILAVLAVGPFALPLLWLNPKLSMTVKIVGTIVVLVISYYLWIAFMASLRSLMDYYKEFGIILQSAQ